MSGLEWCASTPENNETSIRRYFSKTLSAHFPRTKIASLCNRQDTLRNVLWSYEPQTCLTRVLAKAKTNAVGVGDIVHSPIGRRVEDKRAARARRSTPFLKANIISERVAVLTERIAIDLARIEINEAVLIRVLQLQDSLLDFASNGADLDGDAVVGGRADGSAPRARLGGDADFRAAALLVADVEIDGVGAVVADVGGAEGGGGDVWLGRWDGAEGGDGRGGGDGFCAGGEDDWDLGGLADGGA